MISDLLRYATFVAAGFYFAWALAVMVRYMSAPPQSKLRRMHVWGVAIGTSLLVAGGVGGAAERLGESVVWYGAPLTLAGTALVVAALAILSRDQAKYGPGSDDPASRSSKERQAAVSRADARQDERDDREDVRAADREDRADVRADEREDRRDAE